MDDHAQLDNKLYKHKISIAQPLNQKIINNLMKTAIFFKRRSFQLIMAKVMDSYINKSL